LLLLEWASTPISCKGKPMWNASAITRDASVAAAAARGVWQWILRLGAFGFIPLGIADASVVPLPGSMDILMIALAAAHREWWLYYAVIGYCGISNWWLDYVPHGA